MFLPNIMPAAAQTYPPAPIEKILKKQTWREKDLEKYQANITRSYSLSSEQLKKMLDAEYAKINSETKRMQKIKQNWHTLSYAYQFANYKLNEQISEEITQSRKQFAKRKAHFNVLLKNTPATEKIYLIESTDPLFFYQSIRGSSSNTKGKYIQIKHSAYPVYYISVFNHKYQHLFTYQRQHVDMLQKRRIVTFLKTKNERVNRSFQKLFDDYLVDLKRIGAGLDITNRDMLTKLNDMQDEYRSE